VSGLTRGHEERERHHRAIGKAQVAILACQEAVAAQVIEEKERADTLVPVQERVVLDEEIEKVRRPRLGSRIQRLAVKRLLDVPEDRAKLVASLSAELPHADAEGVSLYAFSVCCAAVLLGATRHPWAALWCAGAPLALLAYFAVLGFHPALETAEKVLLVAIVVAWLLYSRRTVAVARAWHGLTGSD